MKMFSVTRVLGNFYSLNHIAPAVLNNAARRGTIVHGLSGGIVQGIPLNMDWIDKDYRGYIDSFKRWVDQYVKDHYFVEERFDDLILGYYGHPDFAVKLIDGSVCLVDLKTPVTSSSVWKLQLAAYRELVKHRIGIDRSLVVQPKKNGSMAKVVEYMWHADDYSIFLNALNVVRYLDAA